jgi:mRNA interferase MazF
MMKKGSIILLPFPFTNFKGSKNRPAVVLYVSDIDVTVCFITSELKWKESIDIVLLPTLGNGLKTNSLIRVNKIATIDLDLILGELGSITNSQITELNIGLKQLLQLE